MHFYVRTKSIARRQIDFGNHILFRHLTGFTLERYFLVSYIINDRGRLRKVAKFLQENNTFHIKSKVIKILCKGFAAILDPLLKELEAKPSKANSVQRKNGLTNQGLESKEIIHNPEISLVPRFVVYYFKINHARIQESTVKLPTQQI